MGPQHFGKGKYYNIVFLWDHNSIELMVVIKLMQGPIKKSRLDDMSSLIEDSITEGTILVIVNSRETKIHTIITLEPYMYIYILYVLESLNQ